LIIVDDGGKRNGDNKGYKDVSLDSMEVKTVRNAVVTNP
jgi:hypothetical protein